jgi:hypothetical protein
VGFLVRELYYSNAATSRRFKAMKCAERFPQVITMLREHRVSLSSLAKAEATLSQASDPEQLLEQIDGKSQKEVERILALENAVPWRPKGLVRRVAVKSNAPASNSLFAAPTPEVEDRVSVRTSLTVDRYEASRLHAPSSADRSYQTVCVGRDA